MTIYVNETKVNIKEYVMSALFEDGLKAVESTKVDY